MLTRTILKHRFFFSDYCSDRLDNENEHDLSKSIERLQRKRRSLEQRRVRTQCRVIANLIKQFDLPIKTIHYMLDDGSKGRVLARHLIAAFFDHTDLALRKPALPKYENPQTGEQWAGRGRTPAWISRAEALGIDRETFRTAVSKQREQKKKHKQKHEPRYRDPISGKTWSGIGRPPLWIKKAIAKGARRDDFLIHTHRQLSTTEASEA